MYRQSEKNLLNTNTSSTCPHNTVNFGPLTAEICWRVWGTPANFNGFRVMAALLHGSQVVSVSQTAALNRGRHLWSAGRPSRWALAHILAVGDKIPTKIATIVLPHWKGQLNAHLLMKLVSVVCLWVPSYECARVCRVGCLCVYVCMQGTVRAKFKESFQAVQRIIQEQQNLGAVPVTNWFPHPASPLSFTLQLSSEAYCSQTCIALYDRDSKQQYKSIVRIVLKQTHLSIV